VGILAKPSSGATEAGQRAAEPARRLDPKPTLIVASPVPAGEIATKRDRLNQLQAAVGKAVVKLSYHPQMALMESIFTRDYREEYLAREYDALLRKVLDMASDSTYPDVSDLIAERSHAPPSAWRDAVAQSLRFASATGIDWPLDFLLKTFNVDKLREDRDFISWDRMCRVLSRGKEAAHLDALGTWADVLSQWSLCSTDPELAQLRREAGARCYDEVLQADEASSRKKARALYNRGVRYGQGGVSERAIADYTAVIQMPDAPAQQKAKTLVNRGLTYGQGGDSKRAITDYTAVVQTLDAPAEPKVKALHNRGWQYFVEGRIREAIEDEQHAVSIDPKNCTARANLAIALLADGRTDAAFAAYDAALDLANVEHLAEMTSDLEMATQKYGPLAGADEVLIRINARRESPEH
jgi:tetratricopeptide (TPR) repeat protein